MAVFAIVNPLKASVDQRAPILLNHRTKPEKTYPRMWQVGTWQDLVTTVARRGTFPAAPYTATSAKERKSTYPQDSPHTETVSTDNLEYV